MKKSSNIQNAEIAPAHIFLLHSGFQYFFARRLIAHKNLQNPIFVTFFNQEPRVVETIKKQNPRVFDLSPLGKIRPLKKCHQALRKSVYEIVAEIGRDYQNVEFYGQYHYTYKLSRFFIRTLKQNFRRCHFHLIPESANLMLPSPMFVYGRKKYLRFLLIIAAWFLPQLSPRHISGSFCRFVDKIYHFRTDAHIYAPSEKIEWVKIAPPKNLKPSDKILFIESGHAFNEPAAAWILENLPKQKIIYRPHPGIAENLRKRQIEAAQKRGFEILENLDTALEEYIFETNFAHIVSASFSTVLIIGALFCPACEAVFLGDKKMAENFRTREFRPLAKAVGIRVVEI